MQGASTDWQRRGKKRSVSMCFETKGNRRPQRTPQKKNDATASVEKKDRGGETEHYQNIRHDAKRKKGARGEPLGSDSRQEEALVHAETA